MGSMPLFLRVKMANLVVMVLLVWLFIKQLGPVLVVGTSVLAVVLVVMRVVALQTPILILLYLVVKVKVGQEPVVVAVVI